MTKDIPSGNFVKSKDYDGLMRGRFGSNMSSTRYKDMRVTSLRPTGFKAAWTFQPTRNNAQMTKHCQLHGPNNFHDTN
jgi:hypothetical protein